MNIKKEHEDKVNEISVEDLVNDLEILIKARKIIEFLKTMKGRYTINRAKHEAERRFRTTVWWILYEDGYILGQWYLLYKLMHSKKLLREALEKGYVYYWI